MEFRWVAILALWTLLVGPIFNAAVNHQAPQAQSTAGARTPSTTAQR
jgi:hypothetical protein